MVLVVREVKKIVFGLDVESTRRDLTPRHLFRQAAFDENCNMISWKTRRDSITAVG